ncbi:hypothetical protein FGB62_21g13 [Gracilaria domingensis]|nr:hypothetical protein FGB62_21g13 [Gracilaria domingensis]
MAASEGVIMFSTPKTKYTLSQLQNDLYGHQMLNYSPDNFRSKWYGEQNFKFAANTTTKSIVEAFAHEGDMPYFKEEVSKAFDATATQFVNQLNMSLPDVNALWASGILIDGASSEERSISIYLRSKQVDDDIMKVVSRTVVLMRALQSIVLNDDLKDGTDQRMSVEDAVEMNRSDFSDEKVMSSMMQAWPGSKSMFMLDCRQAYVGGQDEKTIVVLRAKQRILMQLRGVGGFIVEKTARKFEISSTGDGSTGLYYREYVIGETYTKNQEDMVGVDVGVGVDFGVDLGFSVSAEIDYNHLYGWSVTTEENPTEWKRVKEKTFLDCLSDQYTSLGRLILFMNWYVGGMSEWFYSPGVIVYGNIMQYNPTTLANTKYVDSIKIDSYFWYGDVMAASDADTMDMRTVARCHQYLNQSKDGVLNYRRLGTLYKQAEFSMENALAVALCTDEMRSMRVD